MANKKKATAAPEVSASLIGTKVIYKPWDDDKQIDGPTEGEIIAEHVDGSVTIQINAVTRQFITGGNGFNQYVNA